MLAISPLTNPKNGTDGEMEGFTMEECFPDFSDGNLLDSIDFDDLFLGISDGDVLPDLEIPAEFSFSASDESEARVPSQHDVVSVSSSPVQREDRKDEPDKVRKPMARSGKTHGKKKAKVDWTPDLHRRFVQAVEQLGLDKAVPSKILELMGINNLTRHNIASHLQKYRSHRKHLLAREAEAASWSQKRHLYGGSGEKRQQLNPWSVPTMGFPPLPVAPHPLIRPLHVWGHPPVNQSMMPIWPKHPPPPPHAWTTPPSDPSFWIPTTGTPCFPPHLPPAGYPSSPAPVAGVPPGGIYQVASPQTLPLPPSDSHPSKESVDAAIGDVLSKRWLPLPLGLKAPSVEGVMMELQRQGISNVPPSCAYI